MVLMLIRTIDERINKLIKMNMKKILLLLLLAISTNAHSQESILDMFKNKERRAKEAVAQKEREISDQSLKILPKSDLDWAGYYLKKSSKMQYGAIGCAAASAGMFISSTCIKEKFDVNKKGEISNKSNGTKNALMVGAGISLVASVICEFCSIHYKMKSGDRLRLQAAKNGAGLALVF